MRSFTCAPRGAAHLQQRAKWEDGWLKLAVTAFVLAAASCADGERPSLAGGGDTIWNMGPDRCATPNEGCECEPGSVVECAERIERDGDYVTCNTGLRTCGVHGTYGACVGTHVTTKYAPADSRQAQALGSSTPCSDVCDPYCNQFVDDPIGLPLDGGTLTLDDGGITVGVLPGAGVPVGGVVPGATQTTSNGDNTCTGAVSVPHGSCSGPADCQQDFRCSGGSCVWNGADGYYDSSAGGVDLTIGAACATGAGVFIVPVCNRGSAALAGGTSIGINFRSAHQSGCIAIGAPDCSATVPASGLGAGQCMNVASCTPPDNSVAIVNAGQRDVSEAPGRCANNSASTDLIGGSGCAACTTCNTRISGTVRDPGLNVPLSKVAVFQPAQALTPLNDGVSCDTCASLSTPYLAADYSAANGSFLLNYATPGPNQRLILQTGRWRRENVTVNVTACQNNVIADQNLTRLPKNSSEGTIPKMALVLGERESLECMLLKMGIDQSEITGAGAPSPGRIHLYEDNGMTPEISLRTTSNGRVTCSGGMTQPGSCTAATALTACQQDFRCNTSTNTCVWNGAQGYYDPAAGGVDLTIGATCTSGSTRLIPVCNRGSTAVPGGSVIRVDLVDTLPSNTCSPGSLGSAECQATLPASGLAPGDCINVSGCTPANNQVALVNGTLSIAEAGGTGTTGRCRNNAATADLSGGGCSPTCTTTSTDYAPAASTLWGSAATLNSYTAVLMPCSGTSSYSYAMSSSDKGRVVAYANAGGRLFADHFSGDPIIRNSSDTNWSRTATWATTTPTATPSGGTPARGRVLGTTGAHTDFLNWLLQVNAYAMTAPIGLQVDAPRQQALDIPNATLSAMATPPIEWIRGQSTNNWSGVPSGNYSLSYSFEAPLIGAPKCGRVIFNGMHVSEDRGPYPTTGSSFPSACVTGYALTPEEKALEYQLFQLTACAFTPPPLPPPPSFPPSLPPSVTFYRDFDVTCPMGTKVRWLNFEWQATVPPGTSIGFRAASADTQAALPPSPPALAPTTVAIGTANATVVDPQWGRDANTVAWHLGNQAPGSAVGSKPWLRVYITLNTASPDSPTLWAWRQLYACSPAE
jgi:hypothetical protein